MERILLAIDHSGPSWEATRLAIHMTPKLNAQVTVLNVVVPATRWSEGKDQANREYEAARGLVDDVVKELKEVGVDAKGKVRTCKAEDVVGKILSSATQLETDLIIMGSRARGELTGLLLGSVSHGVAMGSRCPVVIVPTGTTTNLKPRRIVLVIDGEGDIERPVTLTAQLAQAVNAEVEVVCASRTLGDDVEPSQSRATSNPDEEAVAAASAQLIKKGLDVRWRMIDNRRGFAPEIAREVMAKGADMVVIGARAIGLIGGDVAAGAAEALVHRIHRPVVVAPARRRS
jgi:nucleotide-binding universal stress UspA family protein